MTTYPYDVPIGDEKACLRALLDAPRPGAERILAFYDYRIGMICKDPRLLLAPLDDHVCHRGDGVFESVCYRERKIFALDRHLERLRDGAGKLGIVPPFSFERVRDVLRAVAAAGGKSDGDLRVFLTRGPGGFGVDPAECPRSGFYAVAVATKPPSPLLYEKGLTAFASEYPPKQAYLAGIKNTNYLPNALMAAEARRRGMDVAITFDERGHMAEAAVANVAIVDESGRLRAPELKRVLPGTTLLAALKLASARMPTEEGPITKEDIYRAREMMLFTSATLCVPITSFDGRPIGFGETRGKPGSVAHWLKDALLETMLANGTPF